MLRLSTKNKTCFVTSANTFHVDVKQLNNVLCCIGRPIYVKLSDVEFPAVRRSVDLKLYYGLRDEYKQSSVTKISIEYGDFAELCLCFNYESRKMMKSLLCKISEQGHGDHTCEKIDAKLFLSLNYNAGRFVLETGAGFVCVVSCNFAVMLGLKDACDHDVHDDTCFELIELNTCHVIGTPVNFFSDTTKRCHFVMDGLVKPLVSVKGSPASIIASYEVDNRKLMKFSDGLFKLNDHIGSTLTLYVVDDFMRSYFEVTDQVFDMSFILTFLSPI